MTTRTARPDQSRWRRAWDRARRRPGPRRWRGGPCCRCRPSSVAPSSSPGSRSSPTRASSTPRIPRRSSRSWLLRRASSPIHALVAHLQHVAVPLGVVIALGEFAVGVGTLVGLWSRLGRGGRDPRVVQPVPDGQLPLEPVLHGIRHRLRLCLDAAARRGGRWRAVGGRDLARTGSGLIAEHRAALVPVSFDVVQTVCGAYDAGWCRARAGAPCEPARARTSATARAARRPAARRHRPSDLYVADDLRGRRRGRRAAAAGLAAGLGRLGGKSGQAGTPVLNPSTLAPPSWSSTTRRAQARVRRTPPRPRPPPPNRRVPGSARRARSRSGARPAFRTPRPVIRRSWSNPRRGPSPPSTWCVRTKAASWRTRIRPRGSSVRATDLSSTAAPVRC